MRIKLVLLAGIVALAGSASAQPTVAAVVNAAKYGIQGLPGYGVAQGSLATAFGTGFPAEGKQVTSLPLTTTWEGVSIKITVNSVSVDAYPLIMQGVNQLSFIVPSDTPVGDGNITITVNGVPSPPGPIRVLARNFGAFTKNFSGQGAGVLLDPTGAHANGLTYAANPGEMFDIWGTGLGRVDPTTEAAAPSPGDIANTQVTVTVGGKPATVNYKGRSGCCIGLDQVRITVPSGITGCYVPVMVSTGDGVSNSFTMAIAASGRVCSDSTGLSTDLVNAIANGGTFRYGGVQLTRATENLSFGGLTISSTTDTGSGIFEKYDFSKLSNSSTGIGLQPFGSCYVYTFSGQAALPTDITKPTPLDAGAQLSLSGPNGTKSLPKDTTSGFYSATLSTPGGLTGGGTGWLDPGTYTVTGPGGADVSAFTSTLTLPSPELTWTNMSSITTVVRSAGQLVTWSGGDPNGYISIVGFSTISTPQAAGAGFLCTAKVSDQSFTIPPEVLLAIPASPSDITQGLGFLSVGASVGVPFSATGIDQGYFSSTVSAAETVTYQ